MVEKTFFLGSFKLRNRICRQKKSHFPSEALQGSLLPLDGSRVLLKPGCIMNGQSDKMIQMLRLKSLEVLLASL